MDLSLEFLQNEQVVIRFVSFVSQTLSICLVAECNYLHINFEHPPKEEEGWKEMDEHYPGKELSIRDILKNSTFRGFSAV